MKNLSVPDVTIQFIQSLYSDMKVNIREFLVLRMA